jgi:hypothetical protein
MPLRFMSSHICHSFVLQGLAVYLPLWGASLLFLAANINLLCQLLLHTKPRLSFLQCSILHTERCDAQERDMLEAKQGRGKKAN